MNSRVHQWTLRATTADLPAVDQLLTLAGAVLDRDIRAATTSGTTGSIIPISLPRNPVPTSQLATNVMAANKANDPWLQVFMAATTVTVAEIDGQVVGVLLATPPPNIARQLGDTAERINPGSGRQALASIVLRLVRLSAVAVSPAYQHTGIAKALISRGVENYRRAGYIAMYGQFESSRQLAPFYEKLGFQVCGAGEDLDFGDVFGPPLTIGPHPGEQLFRIQLR